MRTEIFEYHIRINYACNTNCLTMLAVCCLIVLEMCVALDACSVPCHTSTHFVTVAIRYSEISIILIVTSCAIKALLQHITIRHDPLWLTASSMRTELCESDMLNYLFDNISYIS
jgi:hypothetical protein